MSSRQSSTSHPVSHMQQYLLDIVLRTENSNQLKVSGIRRLNRASKWVTAVGQTMPSSQESTVHTGSVIRFYRLVAYWPRPCCQKKKCTCVNNRCIRSKISGDQGRPRLSRGWIECELWRSQEVGGRQIVIWPRRQEVQISWREDAGMRTMSQQRLGPRLPVEQHRRTGKKGCDSQKSWGVNMLQSLFCLQLPLTHNPFNKVRGIFF